MNQSYTYQSDEESIYQPRQCNQRPKKCKKTHKKKVFNKMAWSDVENKKYCDFMTKNKMIFQDIILRKKTQIFVKMSRFIRSRNQIQCRTHHQKMIRYYESIEGILSHLEKRKQVQIVDLKQTSSILLQINKECQFQKHLITSVKQKIAQNTEEKGVSLNQNLQQKELWKVVDNNIWKFQ